MGPPRPELGRFLAEAFPRSEVRSIAGDASTRRFCRVRLPDGTSRVVMDYGAPFEGETDDIRLTRLFERAALPVAQVLQIAPEVGCLVLEDLGDCTMETALVDLPGAGSSHADCPPPRDLREDLYRKAVDLARAVAVRGTQALVSSPRASGPALDGDRLCFEMDFFIEHYVLGFMGRRTLPSGLRDALYGLAREASEGSTPILCHRDYHSRNLMVRTDGSLAMVDIQDARWGPDSYDLASLLRDAYVELDDELVERMIDAYRKGLPDPPAPNDFRARFDVVAAQRMIKALGTFGHQAHVLGRQRYLSGVPRTLDRIGRFFPRSSSTASIGELLRSEGLLHVPSR